MIHLSSPTWSTDIKKYRDGLYSEYRIPGIVATDRGTLLCYYEARTNLRDDWGKIDIVVQRSEDNGMTWHYSTIALDPALGGTANDTLNNPTMIVDGSLIHMIFHKNYSRAFHCYSADDGCSWSSQREITSAFHEFEAEWNVCATGPGHGLRTHGGRLIAPVWVANGRSEDPYGLRREHEPSMAGTIYSDDRGETWHAGLLTEGLPDANETTIAERPDGGILLNFRTRYKGLRRTLAVSPDGISDFERTWICNELPDPMCFGSMLNCSGNEILFLNCDVGTPDESKPDQFIGEDGRTARINLTRPEYGARENLTIKCSQDGGETWEKLADVDSIAGYADLALHRDRLYVLYEFGPWNNRIVERLVLKQYLVIRD